MQQTLNTQARGAGWVYDWDVAYATRARIRQAPLSPIPFARTFRRLRQAAAQRRAISHKASRKQCVVRAEVATKTATVKIGTRGSPLALAQAYMTRDLLKVRAN